jgi:hypothetical protein
VHGLGDVFERSRLAAALAVRRQIDRYPLDRVIVLDHRERYWRSAFEALIPGFASS